MDDHWNIVVLCFPTGGARIRQGYFAAGFAQEQCPGSASKPRIGYLCNT